jgi:hypothetical protein
MEPGSTKCVEDTLKLLLAASLESGSLSSQKLSAMDATFLLEIKYLYMLGGDLFRDASFLNFVSVCSALLAKEADTKKVLALIGAMSVLPAAPITDDLIAAVVSHERECIGLEQVVKGDAAHRSVVVRFSRKCVLFCLEMARSEAQSTSALSLVKKLLDSWATDADCSEVLKQCGSLCDLVSIVDLAHTASATVAWVNTLAGDDMETKARQVPMRVIKDLAQKEVAITDMAAVLGPDSVPCNGTLVSAALSTLSDALLAIGRGVSSGIRDRINADKAGLSTFKDMQHGAAGECSWYAGAEGEKSVRALVELYSKTLATQLDTDAAKQAVDATWLELDMLAELVEVMGAERVPSDAIHEAIEAKTTILINLSVTVEEAIILAGIAKLERTNRPALKRYVQKQQTWIEKHKLTVHAAIATAVATLLTSSNKLL